MAYTDCGGAETYLTRNVIKQVLTCLKVDGLTYCEAFKFFLNFVESSVEQQW